MIKNIYILKEKKHQTIFAYLIYWIIGTAAEIIFRIGIVSNNFQISLSVH